MNEKKISFKVDYSRLDVINEYNTKNQRYPLVLSVPHSGRVFPEEFYKNVCVDENELRSNEDPFIDELVMNACEQGIPMAVMNIGRAFIDVNRDSIEIDPMMFYNYPNPGEIVGNSRCRVGLGLLHRITSGRKNIYDGLLDYNEALLRIKNVYDVYHHALQKMIDRTVKKFGFCLVLDCHSMPSKICNIMQDNRQIEFCLGTLFEQSAPNEIIDFVMQRLGQKYNVSLDCPYSGAYISFNYCQPRQNIYTLQMEVNRSLYEDEAVYKKSDNFQYVSTDICAMIIDLGNFLLDFKK
ncbi:MAG: N-formylglutamate amidohydrolase [Alphaproteobacteria bacterium]|nr:N-formylglutamate amidohydrolase [Alphaproteobacteria bacterium]